MIPRSELLALAIILIIVGAILYYAAIPLPVPLGYWLIIVGIIVFAVWIVLVVTRR
jgi:uncharacterized membrane protein